MIIFTASIGRRMAPQRNWPGVRMVCFSDKKPPAPWKWIRVEPSDAINRQTKRIKILPWEHFEDWDVSVWIDANIELTRIPDLDTGLAIHKHRDRDCIFAEAKKCIEYGKDDPAVIQAQMDRYADHPKNWGLWENGMLYRRNTPEICALCEDWWREVDQGSERDQLSLPVVLRRHGIRPLLLGPSIWKGSNWCKRHHKQ